MNIVSINLTDQSGGAESMALNTTLALRKAGHNALFLVKRKTSRHDCVQPLNTGKEWSLWTRFWIALARKVKTRNCTLADYASYLIEAMGAPRKAWRRYRGLDDFDWPGVLEAIAALPQKPDLIHIHNLHGNYFDLRILPQLTQRYPTVITLHDAWLLSGHCAHSFGCNKWKTGCGNCPDLRIPHAVTHDATHANWQLKKAIFSNSQVHLISPSKWLMTKVRASHLTRQPGYSIVPNGVNTAIFKPRSREAARKNLNLDTTDFVILAVANWFKDNPFKDYHTLKHALDLIQAQNPNRAITFLCIGQPGTTEYCGRIKRIFVPFIQDVTQLARYYNAADVFMYAAHEDTFPTTILEALASGLPIIATRTGGIVEQVREHETGFLVAPGDAAAMAEACTRLIHSPDLRRKLGEQAAIDADRRFTMTRYYADLLTVYHQAIQNHANSAGKRDMMDCQLSGAACLKSRTAGNHNVRSLSLP